MGKFQSPVGVNIQNLKDTMVLFREGLLMRMV